MVVCTFFTTGTPYQAEAGALRRSVEAQGLRCEVVERPHPGSWLEAQVLTPGVIAEVRWRLPRESVLFLDADARLEAPPRLLLEWEHNDVADVGVYLVRDGGKYAIPPRGATLCSGTTWWAATEAASAVLFQWQRVAEGWCARTQHRGSDQLALYGVMQHNPDVRWGLLPAEYCWIEEYSETRFPEAAGRIVVRHLQKSREYKTMVDRMKPAVVLREMRTERVT